MLANTLFTTGPAGMARQIAVAVPPANELASATAALCLISASLAGRDIESPELPGELTRLSVLLGSGEFDSEEASGSIMRAATILERIARGNPADFKLAAEKSQGRMSLLMGREELILQLAARRYPTRAFLSAIAGRDFGAAKRAYRLDDRVCQHPRSDALPPYPARRGLQRAIAKIFSQTAMSAANRNSCSWPASWERGRPQSSVRSPQQGNSI